MRGLRPAWRLLTSAARASQRHHFRSVALMRNSAMLGGMLLPWRSQLLHLVTLPAPFVDRRRWSWLRLLLALRLYQCCLARPMQRGGGLRGRLRAAD